MDTAEDDGALVESARNGNRGAMATLLARHQPRLFAVCRRALGDDSLADDAAQEACLQALLSLDRLRDPARFGPWLVGIGLNCCHQLRRQRMRAAWSWEAMPGGRRLPGPVDTSLGPEEVAEGVELRAWIDGAVANLPPGQRAAVILHYLAGLTQKETAALLNIEVGAVKTRLHNARARLRHDLWHYAGPVWPREGERSVDELVAMRVVDVRRRRAEDAQAVRHFVVLGEIGGERVLPIWIGEFEAIALAMHLEGVPQARPLTYAFAADLFRAVAGQLQEVRIDRLEGNVFYATAVVEGPSGQHAVDARPSDALNMALVLDAPIRVAEAVLAETMECSAEEWMRRDELTEGMAAIVEPVVAAWGKAAEPPSDAHSA